MAAIDPTAIREHMEVIAADGVGIGKVDHMQDGRIKLTKNDSPDGEHHFVPLGWIDRVDSHVHLNRTLGEIKAGGVAPTDAVPDVGLHDAVPGKG